MKQRAIYLLLVITMNSCYTMRPDTSGISKPDYNERIEVRNPHYIKHTNAIGYSIMGVSIIGGGYIGNKLGLIKQQNGDTKQPMNVANVAIGAALGFGINMIVNKINHVNKIYPANDLSQWAKKANNNYIALANTSKPTLISKSVESNYHVKTLSDVRDFEYAFKNSSYTNDVITQSASSLNRNDLPEVVKTFNNYTQINTVKKAYILRAEDVKELLDAAKQYQNTYLDIEREAVNKVVNYNDVSVFNYAYPQSAYKKDVFINGLKKVRAQDLMPLDAYYPSRLVSADLANTENDQRKNYMQLILKKENAIDHDDATIDNLFTTYSWLQYDEKKYDYMNITWDSKLAKTYDGNKVIYSIAQLPDKKIKWASFSSVEVKDFVNLKLKEVIDNEVHVTNIKLPEISNSENWEHFNKNTLLGHMTGNPIFISDFNKDNIIGAYTARLINTSKFDLKIKLQASAKAYLSFNMSSPVATRLKENQDKGLLADIGRLLGETINGFFDASMNKAMNEGLKKSGKIVYSNPSNAILGKGKAIDIALPFDASDMYDKLAHNDALMNLIFRGRTRAGINMFGIIQENMRVQLSDEHLQKDAIDYFNNSIQIDNDKYLSDYAAGKYTSETHTISGKKYNKWKLDAEYRKYYQLGCTPELYKVDIEHITASDDHFIIPFEKNGKVLDAKLYFDDLPENINDEQYKAEIWCQLVTGAVKTVYDSTKK